MIIDITIPHLKKKYILKILHYITLLSIYVAILNMRSAKTPFGR